MTETTTKARRGGKAWQEPEPAAEQLEEQPALEGMPEEPLPGAETADEQAFRLADRNLADAARWLRRLVKHSDARDALKLVRQAQNLLMDAEDAADLPQT